MMFASFIILASSCTAQSPWTTDYLTPPDGAVLEVGGMGFMSDGDMVVSTRRGQVWRIENPNAENPSDASFKLICEGLHEGLGLAVLEDEIYVMQRSEVSKLLDIDGDELIDEVQTITQDFGMSGNYHEFGFGLPVDQEGNMYFSLNVGFWNPHWWHGKSRAPYRGWVLKLAPDGTVMPLAGGLRSPAGMGLLEDGTLLVTDNQGDWMPVCPVFAIKQGAFYGHPASLRWYEDQPDVEPSDTLPHPDVTREHPALWLPYKWSRSTGNVILDTSGGPFQGQYLIAELTNGQILRANFETINGVLQGACWPAHERVGSSYHIEYGPDGTLYAGMTNRGWGGLAPGSGIARVKYNGVLPLEMQSAHLIDHGFEITFTKPLEKVPVVTGEKYDYNYWWEYGSPRQHVEPLQISNVDLSPDGRKATVTIDNLESGKCVMVQFSGAMSTDGSELLHPEFSYTINTMPAGELHYIAKTVEPPIERGEEVEGWLYLTWADAFGLWNSNGVSLCDAELDIQNPAQFNITDGNGALVANENNWMETTCTAGSGQMKLAYMLTKGAVISINLPNGMTYTLQDKPTDGYLSPGIWHNLLITYGDEVIEEVEINGVVAEQHLKTKKSGSNTLRIESQKGMIAFGDVRLKQNDMSSKATKWTPVGINTKELHTTSDATWKLSDAGNLEVSGTGELILPLGELTSSIRFDTKIQGEGRATIQIGSVELDIATHGERKTGGITNHPMRTNLIDQNEWCVIEVHQDESTTRLSLNGIEIMNANDVPEMKSDEMRIHIQNATLSIRRLSVEG